MPKITIEIDDGENGSVLFPPASMILRGAYFRHHSKPNAVGKPAIREIPDFPGLCIELNTEKREARIYDPLSDERNAEFAKKVLRYAAKIDEQEYSVVPEKVFDDLDENDVRSWLYAMLNIVAGGYAKLQQGSQFPEIKGEVRVNYYDWSEKGAKKARVNISAADAAGMIAKADKKGAENAFAAAA